MKLLKSLWQRTLVMWLLKSAASREELLDLLEVAKILPKRNKFSDVTGRCLRILIKGETLTETHLKSMGGGSFRLSRVIGALLKKGWPIHSSYWQRADGGKGMECECFLDREFLDVITGKDIDLNSLYRGGK